MTTKLIDWILAIKQNKLLKENLTSITNNHQLKTKEFEMLLEKSNLPELDTKINSKYNTFINKSLNDITKAKKSYENNILLTNSFKDIYIDSLNELNDDLLKADKDPILTIFSFLKDSIKEIENILKENSQNNELVEVKSNNNYEKWL